MLRVYTKLCRVALLSTCTSRLSCVSIACCRRPILTCIGSPIPVERVEVPTLEQILALHEKYVTALQELYDKYSPLDYKPLVLRDSAQAQAAAYAHAQRGREGGTGVRTRTPGNGRVNDNDNDNVEAGPARGQQEQVSSSIPMLRSDSGSTTTSTAISASVSAVTLPSRL